MSPLRRVLRTLALYIVGAWVLMQVADVLFPAIGIPEQAIRYLLLAAVLGFPVALVFAWLFNITPDGIRRLGKAADGDATAVKPLQARDYGILTTLAVLLVLIVYGAVDRAADLPPLPLPAAPEEAAVRAGGPPIVAALPFTFRGAGDDAAFFAGGVHDDLLTQLSQLSGLRVISRTSVLRYAGTTRSIPDIGRELGADAILEGGVQLAGDQIRINAQLIDARNDAHLWAETFDRKLSAGNIFAVQAEIARAIATALNATLSASESAELAVVPTDNLTAYREFHESEPFIFDGPQRDTQRGIALLESAIDRDPGFVKAMVRLVYARALRNFGGHDAAETAAVEQLLTRIGERAPDSTDYLIAQGFYVYYILRDYDAADRLMTLGRARAPSNLELVHIHSWIKKRQGDFDAWIDLTYLGRRLEPDEKRWDSLLVYRLAVAHRYAEALDHGDSVVAQTLSLSQRMSRLQIFRHHDFEQARNELVALRDAHPASLDESFLGDLVLAHLSVRDYAAAETMLVGILNDAEPTTTPSGRIPWMFEWLLTVQLLKDDEASLDATLQQVRARMGLDATNRGESWRSVFFKDRVLLALAAGDAREARSALDEMERVISNDIAPMLVLRPAHCRGLALLGAADEAVRCLRLGIDQPSKVMPFFEPRLPHYDGIRETPEFQQLLAKLTSDGWLKSPAQ